MTDFLDTLTTHFQIAWDDAVQATPGIELDDDQVTEFVRDVLSIAVRPALDVETIARAIHDGPNAQAQYADAGIEPHPWTSCPYQEQYRMDARAVVTHLTGEAP